MRPQLTPISSSCWHPRVRGRCSNRRAGRALLSVPRMREALGNEPRHVVVFAGFSARSPEYSAFPRECDRKPVRNRGQNGAWCLPLDRAGFGAFTRRKGGTHGTEESGIGANP
jgi:hypothetical protein